MTDTSRFMRFFLVGAAAFVIDAGVSLAVTLGGGAHGVARMMGFLCAVNFTYIANRRFTFETEGGSTLPEWSRYMCSQLPAAVLNLGVSISALAVWGTNSKAVIAAVALGAVAGMCINFVLGRKALSRL